MKQLAIAIAASTLLIAAVGGCGSTGSERQAALSGTESEAGAAAPVSSGETPASAAEIKRYWTPKRVAATEPLPVPRTAEPPPSSTESHRPSGGAEPRDVAGAKPVVGEAAEAAAAPKGAVGTGSSTAGNSTDPDFLVSATTTYPNSTVGRLFFATSEGTASCTANVVSSEGKSLIITAGHCAYDTSHHQFYTNFRFIPGYQNGQGLATFYGGPAYVPHGWTTSSSGSGEHYPYDMAAILLYPDSVGQRVQEVAGGRAIAFNTPSSTFEQFGYPATPKEYYNGESLIGCSTKFVGYQEPYTYSSTEAVIEAEPCFQGHGGSGGGWIIPLGSAGSLASVYSHFYCESNAATCGYVYGPYFGSAAEALYNSTRNLAPAPTSQQQTTTTPTTTTTTPTPVTKPRSLAGAARACARIKHRLRQRLPRRIRIQLSRKARRVCR